MTSTSIERATPDMELAMPEIDWGFDPIPDMGDRLVALQEQGRGCVPVRYKGGVAWLVLGYENVRNVFRDEERIPATTFNKAHMDLSGFSLFTLEGAEHKAYKTAVLGRLSPMGVRRLVEKLLVPAADQLIDEIGDDRQVDFMEAYGRRYAFRVMSTLVGVTIPREDEMKILFLVNELSQIQDYHATVQELHDRAVVAIKAINALLLPVVEKRRREPEDDLVSWLINLEINGRKLNNEEIMDFSRSIYEGGSDSSGLQLANILNAILADPDLKDKLVANPEQRAAAIEELMRLNPLVGLISRKMAKETMIAGTLVPAGKLALIGVPGANRSKDHFNDADHFSLEKRKNPPMLFGAGVRTCPGQHLARQLINVSLDRVLDRLPGLRLVGERKSPMGSQARWLRDGMPVAFDDILPAERVPRRT